LLKETFILRLAVSCPSGNQWRKSFQVSDEIFCFNFDRKSVEATSPSEGRLIVLFEYLGVCFHFLVLGIGIFAMILRLFTKKQVVRSPLATSEGVGRPPFPLLLF